MKINKFTGKYYFLCNFADSKIEIDGFTFKNGEAAFQSFKNKERQHEFQDLNPSEAKRLGRSVNLRRDWEEVKDTIMYRVTKAKFLQNTHLADKLIDTYDLTLEEGNTWGDDYWGTCDGKGENMLGRILMLVRTHINSEREIFKNTNDMGVDEAYEAAMKIIEEEDK